MCCVGAAVHIECTDGPSLTQVVPGRLKGTRWAYARLVSALLDAEAAIAIRDLGVTRGRTRVIDGLDLSIPSGAIIGILGPSGSGKTTLLRSIVGAQIIDSGTVTVLGLPAGSRPLRSRVAYLTQQASVYDDLTVRQNLRYFARVLGTDTDDVEHVIERTRLTAFGDRRVGMLSGGQERRVSLAAALLGSPEILVLDEPTVGLDPVLRAELWALFRELANEGRTLLVSSHVMDEATRCDRLVLVRDGAIVVDTTPAGLLAETGAADAESAFLALIERREP